MIVAILRVINVCFQVSLTLMQLMLLSSQVLIPFDEDSSLEVEPNVDLPDYLPEDESPQEPDKAVSRVGSTQAGNSWLGAATNFLSRSFYW